MIKCENLSREDFARIGREIGEAFLAEEGSFRVLSEKSAAKLFALIAETCYKIGHLYTSSENQEGFCVYWTKAERPGAWVQLKMAAGMLGCMSLREAARLSSNQKKWMPTEKRYKNSPDFVEVFLIAVRREYQGQGIFRKMLAEPFRLAEERNTICVLDTDSKLKADKYCHTGMHIAASRAQNESLTMYALEK